MRLVRPGKGFAKEAGALTTANAAGLLLGVLQTVVLAKALGPAELGRATVLIAFPALVVTALDPKSEEAVVRYVGLHRGRGDLRSALAVVRLAYGADAVAGALGLVLLVLFTPLVGGVVFGAGPSASLLVISAVIAVLASPTATGRASLLACRQVRTVATLTVVANVVRTTTVVSFVLRDPTVFSALAGFAVGAVLQFVLFGVVSGRVVRRTLGGSWRSVRTPELEDRRAVVRFMIFTDATSLVSVLVKQADVVILSAVSNSAEVGFYRLARALGAPFGAVTESLQTAILPRLSTDGTGTQRVRDLKALVVAGIALAVVVTIPAVALVPTAVGIVGGDAFEGAVAATRVTVLGAGAVLALFWVRPMLLAGDHIRYLLLNSMMIGVGTLVGFVVLGELLGATGVAGSRSVVAGALGTGAAALYVRRSLTRRPNGTGNIGDDEAGHRIGPSEPAQTLAKEPFGESREP